MPNYIKNKITFSGENTPEILKQISSVHEDEETAIDFNKIIPMPESIQNTVCGSESDRALEYYLAKAFGATKQNRFGFETTPVKEIIRKTEENYPDSIEDIYNLGKLLAENIEKYGAATWYEWACENWSTKWNAFKTSSCGYKVEFETAWSCPENILITLSDMCFEKQVLFEGIFADEDSGNNSGEFYGGYLDEGSVFGIKYNDSCSNEAYETYIELWGKNPCMYKDEDGNWNHYTCDNCPMEGNC